MIFYMVIAAAGQPCQLAGTQIEARDLAKARGLGPKGFMQHDVPTDKAGLLTYINELQAQATISYQANRAAEREADETVGTVTGNPHSEDDPKPAFTQAQVDAMFEPTEKTRSLTPDDVDQVCMLIAQMEGAAIGHVAHELAARIERLGKRVA